MLNPFWKKSPMSEAFCPPFPNSSGLFGSFGTKTPTTPIRPVGRTERTKLFIVRVGCSWPCGSYARQPTHSQPRSAPCPSVNSITYSTGAPFASSIGITPTDSARRRRSG